MSISTVKVGHQGIASDIAQATRQYSVIRARYKDIQQLLANLPSKYSDAISEVNGYAPTGPFETQAKDEQAKLTAEFQALKAQVEADLTALGIAF